MLSEKERRSCVQASETNANTWPAEQPNIHCSQKHVRLLCSTIWIINRTINLLFFPLKKLLARFAEFAKIRGLGKRGILPMSTNCIPHSKSVFREMNWETRTPRSWRLISRTKQQPVYNSPFPCPGNSKRFKMKERYYRGRYRSRLQTILMFTPRKVSEAMWLPQYTKKICSKIVVLFIWPLFSTNANLNVLS